MQRTPVPSTCTNCGKVLTAVSIPGLGPVPEPSVGDVTACLDCHHVMVFGDDMVLRDLTDAESAEIAGDPDLLQVQSFLEFFAKCKARGL